MNKKTTYAVGIVVAVVALAFLGFYLNRGRVPVGVPGTGPMSMRELLAGSQAQKCTFSNNIEGAESSGVVYVYSGKMRTDFIAKTGGQTTRSHMIINGDTAYFWSDQLPQGMRMNIGMMGGPQGGMMANGGFDLDERVGYNCSNWSADQAQFAQPAGITFMELGASLPGANY